jgi:hypothetical protein
VQDFKTKPGLGLIQVQNSTPVIYPVRCFLETISQEFGRNTVFIIFLFPFHYPFKV